MQKREFFSPEVSNVTIIALDLGNIVDKVGRRLWILNIVVDIT